MIFSNGDQVEFADVAKVSCFFPFQRHPKTFENLLSPSFVKNNCCAGLDNSPHVYSKRFQSHLHSKIPDLCKNFRKFWLKQAFGG
jgi:hypothetical protein